MLQYSSNDSGSPKDIIPSYNFGKKMVYVYGVLQEVDWPEDPRLDAQRPEYYSDARTTYNIPVVTTDNYSDAKEFSEYKNKRTLPSYQQDAAIAKRMKEQGDVRDGDIVWDKITDSGGDGGGGGGGGGSPAVDPPPQSNSTNTPLTGESSEMLSMPDLDTLVDEEIERLTLELTNDMKELVISKTVDYESIDFFPGSEVEIIKPVKIKYFREIFNDMCQDVRNLIAKSIYASDKYNYAEYLDLFEVQYNNTNGMPIVSFKVQLPNYNVSGLEVAFLRRKEK